MGSSRFVGIMIAALASIGSAAEAPAPRLRVEAITEGSILHVRNVHSAALTAVLIEMVDYPGGSFRMIQDEIPGAPIEPGEERHLAIRSMLVGVAPDYVSIQAAVYRDGGVSGAPKKVEQIIAGRRARLGMTKEAIRRVEGASQSGRPKPQIIAELEKWQESAGSEVISTAIRQLRQGDVSAVLVELRRLAEALEASKPDLN